MMNQRFVDVSNLLDNYTGPPILIEKNTDAYVSNADDPTNHWLYYAFQGFKALQAQGVSVNHFISIATGPGIDAIGAIEILQPQRITVTDLVPSAIERARQNIARYQESGQKTPVNYVVGDLCEPLGDEKADLIYVNLPNIPIPEEQKEKLFCGIKAASFFDYESIEDAPERLNDYLLALQYSFLLQARAHLTSEGRILLNLGLRVPYGTVNELFEGAGYQHKVLAFGFKLQTEAEECIPGYARFETDQIKFAYYPYHKARSRLAGLNITNITNVFELRDALEDLKMSATEALEYFKQGGQIGHIVTLFEAQLSR